MSKRTWNIYLSGEIHSDWRRQIIEGATAAGLAVNFSAPVISVSDQGDFVSAVVEQDGTQKEVRARYLVGCDGPRSLTRKSQGIEYYLKKPALTRLDRPSVSGE